jgi:condensin complex subunit 3
MIVPLFLAKDKVVRYRATQIVSHIVNSLDSIDDELYLVIRQGLLKRLRDKEPTVRVQAVTGLARLVGDQADEEDDGDDGSAALLGKLIDILQHDTSADVRKTLLLNLPLTPSTLPYLLERARDLDAATRRALYSRLLPSLGDFRHLSLSMREKLLRWGLRDRDENVRKATGKLFHERWIEDCAGNKDVQEGGPVSQVSPPSILALLELVEGGVAHEAMRSFWEGRPDYREEITFDEAFWDNLTAESAFLARSFNDFCREDDDGQSEALADEKMPEVTALAFFLQKYSAALLEKIRHDAEQGQGNEEERVENEFIVEQLLYIALTLDYSDEVGRRKMFALLRENLAVPELPEECTKLTVEVLRCVCGPDATGESEFCSVVLEAVAEVHDAIVTEDSFVSARSELSDDGSSPSKGRASRSRSGTPAEEELSFNKEEAKAKVLREIMINMKCLHIAQCMLQNVEGTLQQNMHLVTMLNNLVVPAVRSHEAPIRERGMECLGLCCLLDKVRPDNRRIAER